VEHESCFGVPNTSHVIEDLLGTIGLAPCNCPNVLCSVLEAGLHDTRVLLIRGHTPTAGPWPLLEGDSGCMPLLLQLQIACTWAATQERMIIPFRVTAPLAPVPKYDMAPYRRVRRPNWAELGAQSLPLGWSLP
jgi:hypothetical protein